MTTGYIFNMQTYSIHDGPGIRTTVFFKGCPLRCLWCQNPESQRMEPQLLYYRDLCTGCRACVAACPQGAVTPLASRVQTDRARCTACGACANACPSRAREVSGQVISAEEAAERACADQLFFDTSGGGVTLSGGEVLAQPEFAAELLRRCKERGVHTAIETSGFAAWDRFAAVLAHTDLVLYDFKHMDPEAHKRLTGVDNALILDNAKRIVHERKLPLVGRIPLIPGLNDSRENIRATAHFIARELGQTTKVHLLPYNPLGESKNESLGQTSIRLSPQSDETLALLRAAMTEVLSDVVIGG